MEPAETPNTQGLNIISSENSKPQNNKFDAQQYFLESENNEENNNQLDQPPIIIKDYRKGCGICLIVFLTILMSISSIPMILVFVESAEFICIILAIVFIILFVFLIILVLKKCGKKLVFSKNIQKNKFYIKRFNFLNGPIIDLELGLGNYYIICRKSEFVDQEGQGTTTYSIRLYNQFNDNTEINLDTTNIKEVPIKLLCIFDIALNGFDAEKQLEERINNFICAKKFKYPFHFNIKAYMNKEEGKNKYFANNFNQKVECIKYSDYFFSFFFKCLYEKIEDVNGVIRIDCIYSENFDRIFIGVVNKDEKSYAKTFEFKMDIIDKFVLQKLQNFGFGYDLNVMFKDKQMQDIWPIENKTQEELEGLVYLLNERLNQEKNNI